MYRSNELTISQKLKLQNIGHILLIDKDSKKIYKMYKNINLLDNPHSIEQRLNQIVQLTSMMNFMPKTTFYYDQDMLVMKQKLLIKQKDLKLINPKKRLALIEEFSCSLDKIYNEGFIHGDINRKNILYANDRLNLIDFEPSFFQIKNKVKQLISTIPYIHHEDIKNKTISIKSDLLGFGCFLKWFLLNNHSPQHYSDECSKIISAFKYKNLPFQNLKKILVNSYPLL